VARVAAVRQGAVVLEPRGAWQGRPGGRGGADQGLSRRLWRRGSSSTPPPSPSSSLGDGVGAGLGCPGGRFMARVTRSGTPAAGSGSPWPGGVAAGDGGQSSCRRGGGRQGSLLLLCSPPSLTTQHLCTAGRSCRGHAFAARGVLLGATVAVAGPGGRGGQRRRRLRGRWVRGRIWRSRAGAAPAMVGHAPRGCSRWSAATAAGAGANVGGQRWPRRAAVLRERWWSKVRLYDLPRWRGWRPTQLCGCCRQPARRCPSDGASMGRQDNSKDGAGCWWAGVRLLGPTFVLEGSSGESLRDGDASGRRFPRWGRRVFPSSIIIQG
jgi:hypothetical protein